MTQFWTILSITNGQVLAPCYATASTGQHPKDAGWAWDATTQRATRISGPPDPARQTFDGTAWVDNPALVEGQLIERLKSEAERRKMALLSSGGAKKAEYAEKRAEVVEADRMIGGLVTSVAQALNTMPTAKRAFVFVHATADALAHGDTPADAIERFRAGALRSKSTATIAGLEQAGCLAIRKAPTAATKQAAFTAAMAKWP